MREVRVTAVDESKGMTAKEIREALTGLPEESHPKVIVGWGGKIKAIKFVTSTSFVGE